MLSEPKLGFPPILELAASNPRRFGVGDQQNGREVLKWFLNKDVKTTTLGLGLRDSIKPTSDLDGPFRYQMTDFDFRWNTTYADDKGSVRFSVYTKEGEGEGHNIVAIASPPTLHNYVIAGISMQSAVDEEIAFELGYVDRLYVALGKDSLEVLADIHSSSRIDGPDYELFTTVTRQMDLILRIFDLPEAWAALLVWRDDPGNFQAKLRSVRIDSSTNHRLEFKFSATKGLAAPSTCNSYDSDADDVLEMKDIKETAGQHAEVPGLETDVTDSGPDDDSDWAK